MYDIQKTVDAYENGILSRIETVFRLACGAVVGEACETMKLVPDELRPLLREYVESYEPGEMVPVGGAPEVPIEALEKLRKWFKTNE